MFWLDLAVIWNADPCYCCLDHDFCFLICALLFPVCWLGFMTDIGLNLWGRMLQAFLWGVWYELPLDTYVKPLISLAYSFPWWMYDCLQGYDLWLHPILLLFWLHWKWHYICFITSHVLGEFRSEIALVFPNWFWSPWSSIVSNCHGFYGMLLSVVLTMYSSLLYRLQIHIKQWVWEPDFHPLFPTYRTELEWISFLLTAHNL